MIRGIIEHQKLSIFQDLIAAGSFDYLTAQFSFTTEDWSGCDIFVHFSKGNTVYDAEVNSDGSVDADSHINLTEGIWDVYLHGSTTNDDDEVTMRITTNTARLTVVRTGVIDGEPFPNIPSYKMSRLIAPNYSDQQTYTKGSYVFNFGNLYKAKDDILAPEAWTEAHWESTSIGEELKAADIRADVEALETEVGKLATDVARNTQLINLQKGKLHNIVELAKGNLYTVDNDDDEAIVKTVPAGSARYAELEKFGGKTIVWNQIAKELTADNWVPETNVSVSFDNGIATFTNSVANYGINFYSADAIDAGDKMLFSVDIASNVNSTVKFGYGNGPATNYSNVPSDNVMRHYASINHQDSASHGKEKMYIWLPSVAGTLRVKNAMAINLTKMFGAGNEPATPAEFEAMFPSYYPYSALTLLSADVSAVKTVGVNLFNKATVSTNSALYWLTGELIEDTGSYVSDYIRVVGGKTIISAQVTSQLLAYDSSKNYIGSYPTWERAGGNYVNSNAEVTLPIGTEFVRLSLRSEDSPNINAYQLQYGSSTTTHKPYKSNIMSIPAAVRALEGYGWSAGSVANTVEYDAEQDKWLFHKRVNRKTIGECVWFYQERADGKHSFISNSGFSDRIISGSYDKFNAISSEFRAVKYVDTWSYGDMAPYSNSSHNICLLTDKYGTSVSNMLEALSEVYIQYELAAEVITDITELMAGFDNYLDTEQVGTIEFVQSNTPALPVPSNVNYMIDIEEALSNE